MALHQILCKVTAAAFLCRLPVYFPALFVFSYHCCLESARVWVTWPKRRAWNATATPAAASREERERTHIGGSSPAKGSRSSSLGPSFSPRFPPWLLNGGVICQLQGGLAKFSLRRRDRNQIDRRIQLCQSCSVRKVTTNLFQGNFLRLVQQTFFLPSSNRALAKKRNFMGSVYILQAVRGLFTCNFAYQ